MSETHSTTENNKSHCCDNTCGNADDRVVPDSVEINPLFARPKEAQAFSKFTIPQKGSLPETAYQVVHDEAMLDGNARLNLATFVSTWMDDQTSTRKPPKSNRAAGTCSPIYGMRPIQ